MNAEQNQTIAVIHPFQQHSFKTAAAVKKSGYNIKYITTVYDKKGSLTHFGLSLLKGNNRTRAERRKTADLSDNEVVLKCELLELLLLILQRVDKKEYWYSKIYQLLLKRFSKSVFKYINKEKINIIILYDIVSADLIHEIKKHGLQTKIILDMSAPYYNYMESQFRRDMKVNSENRIETEKLLENPLQAYKRKYSAYEIKEADAFLVASDYTRRSLVDSGIDNHRIFTCRYGIDDFSCNDITNTNTSSNRAILKVMYAGNINRQKGAYQLIRVANNLPAEKYAFTFYGNFRHDDPVYVNNRWKYRFMGHIPREEMKKAYSESDLFIFPTLADGFGFVVAEALSYGVPVIASSNAGSSDLIKNGVNGFIYEAGNDAALKKLLEMFESDRELLKKMKISCRESIKNITWKQYFKDIDKALKEIVHDNKSKKYSADNSYTVN